MLKIRLQKVGKKNSPSFRVVLVEHTMRPQGKFLELLGSYNKVQKQKSFNKERILHWISKGAQLSPTMNNLLVDEKIIDTPKVKAWSPKKKPASAEATASKPTTPAEAPKEQSKAEPASVPTEVGTTDEAKETPVETPIDTTPKTN